MARHRNIKGIDLTDEMDDPYESSYGTSLDSEPCVSPGTKERYTFNRSSSNHTSRLSDHFHRSRQDSVAEEDEMIHDDENARLGPPDSFEDDGLLFRSDSINNPSTSTLAASQQPHNNHPEKSKSTEKRKLPTPVNEVDSDSLPSKVGQRLHLGPNLANVIPEVRTQQGTDAIPAVESNNVSSMAPSTIKSALNPFRSSPAGSREGSRRSSPAPTPRNTPRENNTPKENKSSINLEALLTEYDERECSSKPLINLVVIGHVDAGKSTLMGRLLCDLGHVSQKQMHRNETDSKKTGKSSFLYAWVLDETEEERSRGITMDVASARFETRNRRVQILDAPGHKDFIPNMITGAAAADVALLVIDATKGEFEAGFESGGQTREHTMLVRSLGVSTIAVVINKLDNVTWSKERYDEICSKMKVFLKQTGFKECDVTFVPTSGLKGENLIKPSSDPNLASWYTGPCLLDVIDNFKPPERAIGKPFRLSIGDIFKGLVSGVSISGRIDAGAVFIGSKLVVMPSAESATVKAITIDDEPVNQAFAGDNVVLVLLGTDPSNVSIGSLVCDASFPCPVATKFEARVVVFNSIEMPITKGLPVAIHYNNSSEQGSIKKIVCSLNKSTGEILKKSPRFLTKNSSGLIVIETSRPVCIELYKDYKDLGRFMIRVSGNTIAAGLVTNIL